MSGVTEYESMDGRIIPVPSANECPAGGCAVCDKTERCEAFAEAYGDDSHA